MSETGEIGRKAERLEAHWVRPNDEAPHASWRVYDAAAVDCLLDDLVFAESNGRAVLARVGGYLKEHDPAIKVSLGAALIELHEFPQLSVE